MHYVERDPCASFEEASPPPEEEHFAGTTEWKTCLLRRKRYAGTVERRQSDSLIVLVRHKPVRERDCRALDSCQVQMNHCKAAGWSKPDLGMLWHFVERRCGDEDARNARPGRCDFQKRLSGCDILVPH